MSLGQNGFRAPVRNTDGVLGLDQGRPQGKDQAKGCPGAGTQVQRLTALLTSAWLKCCWGQRTGSEGHRRGASGQPTWVYKLHPAPLQP